MHELDRSLQRFWELEELPITSSKMKPEDEECESIFKETHRRDFQGLYEVRLPLKQNLPLVGDETRRMALGSLSHMHRRFARDPKLAQGYREFMQEYEKLGHMTPIPPTEIQQPRAWYVSHHSVIQETPDTWKLRVVFDASRRTREGHFLNNFLLSGPPLQRDLSLILLNWRRYLLLSQQIS